MAYRIKTSSGATIPRRLFIKFRADEVLFPSSRTVAPASIIPFQYPEESSFRRFSLSSSEVSPDLVIPMTTDDKASLLGRFWNTSRFSQSELAIRERDMSWR